MCADFVCFVGEVGERFGGWRGRRGGGVEILRRCEIKVLEHAYVEVKV